MQASRLRELLSAARDESEDLESTLRMHVAEAEVCRAASKDAGESAATSMAEASEMIVRRHRKAANLARVSMEVSVSFRRAATSFSITASSHFSAVVGFLVGLVANPASYLPAH